VGADSKDTTIPASSGLVDSKVLDFLLDRVRREVSDGTLPSAQVGVAKDGQLVAFETFGEASSSTRYILQSSGRPVLASVAWKLISDGVLDPAETVAGIIEEFGTNGKEAVTVEQVLTHTAGFPLAPLGYPAMADRSRRLEAFSRWRLTSPPGEVLQYHLTSAGWVIAEIVERRTGLTLPEYLAQEIASPLGLKSLAVAVPVEDQGDIAPFVKIDAEEGEINPWGAWFLGRPEVIAAGEPSHAFVGNASDVVMLLQGIYHSGLWRPDAVADAIRVRVSGPVAGGPELGGSPVPSNHALFVVVAGEHGAGSLPLSVSAQTFGQRGAPSSFCFMDPEESLSFAFLTNGYPLAGYDNTPAGRARIAILGNLAGDLPLHRRGPAATTGG
jgi:CubicO group peptidase (beta-lactamase class C family)